MFTISSQGKSAKDRLEELLYQHSYCIETATITTIPIYYLQPNTRIKVFDEKSNLNGDYVVDKITIPLIYNGTMQLQVTKAVDSIIWRIKKLLSLDIAETRVQAIIGLKELRTAILLRAMYLIATIVFPKWVFKVSLVPPLF